MTGKGEPWHTKEEEEEDRILKIIEMSKSHSSFVHLFVCCY